MSYPRMSHCGKLVDQIALYSQLKHEYGAKGIEPILNKAEKALKEAVSKLMHLSADKTLSQREPNDLKSIRQLRPKGPRRIWTKFDESQYRQKLEGALLGRFAGCTLGSIVEGWPVWKMENLAKENGQAFPPADYWIRTPGPFEKRYGFCLRESYTRDKMNGVPVDDDIAYTLLGLLICEDFGPNFTTEDVGRAWLKYLPYACTAEDIALKNLKAGVPAKKTGERGNPYCEWIGADIRSDPWGYMAPGWPERAASMAYQDAYLSHRRNGIYGEMYFSAVISAAFAVRDPTDALRIGLSEIPKDCSFSRAVRWALKTASSIRNYKDARAAVDRKFKGMSDGHTLNNACLTVWGITIGRTDFTKVIGETVAMGMDNDCTAATAGSIVGAVVGKKGIPRHWHRNSHDTVHSYLTGKSRFRISDLVQGFSKVAATVHGG